MNFQLALALGKKTEIARRKKSPTLVGLNPRPPDLIVHCSTNRVTDDQIKIIGWQVVDDNSVNVKGTNECCAANTKVSNDG